MHNSHSMHSTSAQTRQFLYIDTGTEKFKGHCFYVSDKRPCIYCIHWLFPDRKKIVPLCSIRADTPSTLTEETKSVSVMSILSKMNRSQGQDSAYEETAEEFNRTYNPDAFITGNDVRQIEEDIHPNTPSVSHIIASVVCTVIKKKPSGNFILYSGDKYPIFHKHCLDPSDSCFLCKE